MMFIQAFLVAFALGATCAGGYAFYKAFRSWQRRRHMDKLNNIIHSTLYTSDERSAATEELMTLIFQNHERPG